MKKKKKFKLKKYEKCKVTGKYKYPDEKTAYHAMFATWASNSLTTEDFKNDFHSYLCDYCGSIHNGHMSKYQEYQKKQETSPK